jgi:hypothetical protein
MEDLESELHDVMVEELAWYRDRAILAQAIKEVAREALLDIVADSIRMHHADEVRSILREDAFASFRADEYRKLLRREASRSLMKEATHRAVRLEIKRRLEMPDSVDQLELPWNRE